MKFPDLIHAGQAGTGLREMPTGGQSAHDTFYDFGFR